MPCSEPLRCDPQTHWLCWITPDVPTPFPWRKYPAGVVTAFPRRVRWIFNRGGFLMSVACGAGDSLWLVAGTGGYGFLTSLENITSRNRAGKVFLTLSAEERPLPLVSVTDAHAELFCLSSDGHGLVFPVAEVKNLPRGRGVKLIALVGSAVLQFLSLLQEGHPLPRGLRKNRLESCRGHRGARGRTVR